MSQESEHILELELMDLNVAAIDARINKKKVVITNLENDLDELLKKIQRHKSDLRRLGEKMAEAQTFELKM